MKKLKSTFSFIALLLCALVIFSACECNNETGLNGEGGSDIASEFQETTQAPRYTANDKLIALTFDDGPKHSSTNKILDILEKNNSVATFFVVGYNIDKKIDTIKRAQNMGCEIGNHSNDHKNLTKCSYSVLREQVDTPNETLKSLAGIDVRLFRAPGGNFKEIENDIGMPLIQWSIDTEDWKFKDASNSGRSEAQRNADLKRISDNVIENAEKGDIILMHDIYDFTADLCEIIVPALAEKGFKLVTVSEMYEAYGEPLESGRVYYNVIPVQPAIAKGNYIVKTKGNPLNLRAAPKADSDSLDKIPNETIVTVLDSVDGWAYLEYNTLAGWVNSSFLAEYE